MENQRGSDCQFALGFFKFVLNCQIYNIIFLYCLSKIGFSCMTKMLGAGSNTCITDTCTCI